MINRRFVFFTLLVAYIFAPSFYSWMVQSEGTWLKPFFIWGMIILAAYFFQNFLKAPK